MAKSLFPIALGGRINVYTSVTLSLTKLAFTYASNIVRWVWKCPRHSGTMLSAVAVLAPGQLEYDRDRGLNLAWFPLYRFLPTAPLFAMADGQSYGRGTNCTFTKTGSPAVQSGERTDCSATSTVSKCRDS